jgi:hypothetical protein
MGSRNTLHFYPHGFEILAHEFPLAASVAESLLAALGENKLVPPEIISDRYVVYRVPEFLQAYLDYKPRPAEMAPLPYQRPPFQTYFPQGRIFVSNQPQYYTIANLSKGGVVKIFNQQTGELWLNDCGIIGQLEDKRVVTSQWIDQDYQIDAGDNSWSVQGDLHFVPSNKLFSLPKNLLFRAVLLVLGWSTHFSHLLKGSIRKTLILGQRSAPLHFRREFKIKEDKLWLVDTLQHKSKIALTRLSIGDEFFVRYVPQSRYFQSQELTIAGFTLPQTAVSALNAGQQVQVRRSIDIATGKFVGPEVTVETTG